MIEKENQFLKPTKEWETLKVIKEKTKESLIGMSECHGWEHTVIVANFAKLLALNEGGDIFNAEAAAWSHDWGRTLEKTGGPPHAELSFEISKDFYRKLYEEGKINSQQYGDIQRAIKRHSLMGDTERTTLRIVRDADRLSRFGPVGLYHVALWMTEQKYPFYLAGQPIKRLPEAPVMKQKEAKCTVDMFNFCLSWEKVLETDSAKKIFDKLKKISEAFLILFSRHANLTDEKLWIAFLAQYAGEFKEKIIDFENSFQETGTKEDFQKWLEFYDKIESGEIFSEKNFQEFLKEYNL